MGHSKTQTRAAAVRRIPAFIFLFVVTFWIRLTTWGSITTGGLTPGSFFFAPTRTVHTYNGVRVWQSGATPNRTLVITSFSSKFGFVDIRGHDEYLANLTVHRVIWPHWLFALLAVPPGIWWALVEREAYKHRRRAATGRCVSCGYSLAGNTSAVCPECGVPVRNPPFAVITGPVTATEGYREDDAGKLHYSLTVHTHFVSPDEDPAPYVRKMNEIMLRWLRLRGPECEAMAFAFAPDQTAREPTLINWILRLVNQNVPEANLLQSVRVEILIQDAAGKELKRLIVSAA